MLALSVPELAKAIGYSAKRLAELEDGATEITVAELQHLAGALEVPVTWFTEGARIEHELSGPLDTASQSTVVRLDETEQKAVLDAYFDMLPAEDRQKLISIAHVLAGGPAKGSR